MTSAIGARLRARRRALGLTQEQLCKKTGNTQGYLSTLEAGKGNPSVETLQGIAKVLDCSIDWILTGK